MAKAIPHYNIVFDETKDDYGLEFVSFVAEPAIMEMGLAFAEQMRFSFDKEKQVVVGPAMIPNVPLYRFQDGKEFYVVFSTEVIEKLAEKFNSLSKPYKINVDHNTVVESAFIKSNWIIEDAKNDKSNMYGFSYPVGTWMVEVKVKDAAFWQNEIKDNGKFGFSVEGLFGLEYMGTFKQNTNTMTLTEKEIALITKFRAGELALELTPEDVKQVEEIAKGVAEAVVAEEEVKEEPKEEVVVEEAMAEVVVEPVTEPKDEPKVLDEARVAEMVEEKYQELLAMIAELKTMMEEPKEDVKVDKPAGFGLTEKIQLVKQYSSRFLED